MQPRRSAFFPSSIDEAPASPGTVGAERLGVRTGARLLLAAWAAAVYLAYWLGYLGLR